MRIPGQRALKSPRAAVAGVLLAAVALALALQGCQKASRTAMIPLDQAGMSLGSIDQLQQAQVNDLEVQQLILVRQAGLSDDACVDLVRIAHERHKPFTDGQVVADLAGAGLKQDSVLTLARLNLLDSWAGEAEVMRLGNLSDAIILAVAKRRAAGLTVMSGDRAAKMRNAGLSEAEILGYVEQGISDPDADAFLARRNYLQGGHGFVHETGRRR